MIGKGKKAFVMTVTGALFVVVAVVVAGPPVVVVVEELPSTNGDVAVLVPCVTVPVQVAPMGQHAIFRELSSVQNVPDVQQAPPSTAARVEHELKFVGQFPSLRSNSCIEVSFARDCGSKKSAKMVGI